MPNLFIYFSKKQYFYGYWLLAIGCNLGLKKFEVTDK